MLQGLLNLKAPWWLAPFIGSESLILTKSLEWALSYCILDPMFERETLSQTFIRDRDGLAASMVMVGATHLALLPFMLVYMLIHFFLENAQQFHAQRQYLGPRQWSPLAVWTFREFNELPHVLEERLQLSLQPANQYIRLFHNPHLVLLAQCGQYLAGSLIAVLLAVSVVDENILLFVHAQDHNLVWYLGTAV